MDEADEADEADEQHRLAERFEEQRARLRAVAYRMLGSLTEADDAVQETWLRLSRTGADAVDNLPAWLQTVVSRICLDLLRSRASRREDPMGGQISDQDWPDEADPAEEVAMADAVGRALLVVLDRLSPAERIAFVLHDGFAVPFEQIAPIVDRTPVTTKKLASRARQKVRGTEPAPEAEPARQRRLVEAFLAAARNGDLPALLAVLAPDAVRHADPAALPPGAATTLRGARAVAEQTTVLGRRARFAETALVDGRVGVLVAPRGRLLLALDFTFANDRITSYEVIADPGRLQRLELSLLDAPPANVR